MLCDVSDDFYSIQSTSGNLMHNINVLLSTDIITPHKSFVEFKYQALPDCAPFRLPTLICAGSLRVVAFKDLNSCLTHLHLFSTEPLSELILTY